MTWSQNSPRKCLGAIEVEINKACGIPLPTLSAVMGPLLVLVGSGMYLTGIPVAGQQFFVVPQPLVFTQCIGIRSY